MCRPVVRALASKHPALLSCSSQRSLNPTTLQRGLTGRSMGLACWPGTQPTVKRGYLLASPEVRTGGLGLMWPPFRWLALGQQQHPAVKCPLSAEAQREGMAAAREQTAGAWGRGGGGCSVWSSSPPPPGQPVTLGQLGSLRLTDPRQGSCVFYPHGVRLKIPRDWGDRQSGGGSGQGRPQH